MLRKSQLVVAGYLQEAQLDPGLVEQSSIDNLRHEAVRVEGRFLGDAGRRIDRIIEHLTKQNSGIFVRAIYGTVVLNVRRVRAVSCGAKFLLRFVSSRCPAADCRFLRFRRCLLRPVVRRVSHVLYAEASPRTVSGDRQFGNRVAASRMSQGLFPEVENACRELQHQRERLEMLMATTSKLRAQVAEQPD